MMKKGHILLEKAQIDEKLEKEYFFGFFSLKYWKTKKKVKNDGKGSYIAEKGPNWWKIKK